MVLMDDSLVAMTVNLKEMYLDMNLVVTMVDDWEAPKGIPSVDSMVHYLACIQTSSMVVMMVLY